MIKLFLTLSITLISACGGVSVRLPSVTIERCVVVIETPESIEGFCACHPYTISHEVIGRTGDTVVHPRAYCDRFVGFHPENGWVPLLETLEEAYMTVEDSKKKYLPATEKPDDIRAFVNGR